MLAGTDDHLTWLSPVILNLESTGLTHLESEIRVGDNDGRSKAFLFHRCALRKFHVTVKTRVTRLGVIKGPNARDQIVFCAFHSFLVEVQTNAGYIYATHA